MAIITLTGPTCAGKTTIETELQKAGCGKAVSHTTRQPRSGEVSGTAYHFVTPAEYKHLDAAGEFIETVTFGNNSYAMSAKSLLEAQTSNEHVAIVVEPHGAHQIHQFCKDNGIPVYAVWVDCPPREQAERFLKRMLSDMLVGKDAVGTYADRLALMLTDEVGWRDDVLYSTGDVYGMEEYDFFYNSQIDSAEVIANDILNRINHRM